MRTLESVQSRDWEGFYRYSECEIGEKIFRESIMLYFSIIHGKMGRRLEDG
jgi:hypothetical protein